MTGPLFGNGNYGPHPLALRANLLCSVCGVFGLPASKLLFVLCTYVSSIFLAFISYPVEVRLVNVSEIMGKLKKTSVTTDAAASPGVLSVIGLAPIFKRTWQTMLTVN